MTNPFNVITNVEIETKLINENNELVSFPGIEVNVDGELSGNPGRLVTLTAIETSSLGYTFKEWIVEVSKIQLQSVVIGGYTTTIEDMCNQETLQTELSEVVYTDGQFFYEDQDGNRVSNSGYYGAGLKTYWRHDTSAGISGPFICGQPDTTQRTGIEIGNDNTSTTARQFGVNTNTDTNNQEFIRRTFDATT
jgi:hypothetical protein